MFLMKYINSIKFINSIENKIPSTKKTSFRMTFNYPKAKRESIKENYFGIDVIDPYRWLEDPDSEETKDFIEKQNEISQNYIRSYEYWNDVREKYKEIHNFPKMSSPEKIGNVYYQFRNSGLQNQNVLYKLKSLNSEPEIFLDPNEFSPDGIVTISGTVFSLSGNILAYMVNTAGSDWSTVKFIDADGKEMEDELKKIKFFQPTWLHDDSGVLYSAFVQQSGTGTETTQNLDNRVFYHKLGTESSEDIEVAKLDDPSYMLQPIVTDCGKYVVINVSRSTYGNAVYVADISDGIKGKLNLMAVIPGLDNEYEYVSNNGNKFIFKTDRKSNNLKIVVIDIHDSDEDKWMTLIPERDSALIGCCPVDGDKLILQYIKDVKHTLHLHRIDNGDKIMDIPLPLGSVGNIKGKRYDKEIFFSLTSFVTPMTIFMLDFKSGNVICSKVFEIELGFKQDDYEIKQVFYESKDKEKIPMFIYTRKNIELNGKNPCLITGYGGFNISLTPYFSSRNQLWVTHFNGVFALANIRGGGEYGNNWYENGKLFKKQNCFDDFQYAAKFLIANKYTKPSKIAIHGGSNGGLLMAACVNQAPELFGAACIEVGVLDMLRYHKFTIGKFWMTDYGDPEEENMFKYIYNYSPLHNIRDPGEKRQYPSVLVKSADHDDRVVPLHSLKYIAELQHTVGTLPHQKKPLIALIASKTGHGSGKPTEKIIEEVTDVLSFFAKAIHAPFGKQCLC